jgi:uncharacterized membrane protein
MISMLFNVMNEKSLSLITALQVQLTSSSLDTVSTGVTPRCDWVNAARTSGANETIDNVLGNGLGFLLTYWQYVVIVLVAMAIVTFVVQRNRNRSYVQSALTAVVVAIVLVPVIGLFGGIAGNGPC